MQGPEKQELRLSSECRVRKTRILPKSGITRTGSRAKSREQQEQIAESKTTVHEQRVESGKTGTGCRARNKNRMKRLEYEEQSAESRIKKIECMHIQT
jgi:hypothetical protein